MRVLAPVVALLLSLGSPGRLAGQSMLDLLQTIEEGGGWVHIPIQAGQGSLLTSALPTVGLTLSGCMQVYAGHAGRWHIRARDALGEGRLDVSVAGGEHVPFRYRTGLRSQLSVEARWSEARDTTLLVWVGLEAPGRQRDVCAPIYGSTGAVDSFLLSTHRSSGE
jgi:hypothetical protein